jgi:hypothetical protein
MVLSQPFRLDQNILTPHNSFGIPLADSHFFQIYAVVFCDLMWFSRNQAVHKGIIPDVSKLAANTNQVSLDHLAAWTSKPSPIRELWSPSSPESFKVNFDTATRDEFSTQAAVCRNSTGKIIKILSQVRPPCSPAYGEAQAALLACTLATSLHFGNFVIKGDSSTVIYALQNPSIVLDWQLDHIICNIFSLIPASSTWKTRKVNRSVNFYTHYVAYRAAVRASSNCIPSLSSPLLPHL